MCYSSTTLNFDKNYKFHYLLFLFGSLHWISSKWQWLISVHVRVKRIILCSMLHDTVFQTCSQHVHCSQWYLLRYAGMTNVCYFGEHWPRVTRSWYNFCFLVEYPSTYLHFISEEEELRLSQSDSLFKTQHQSHFDSSYLFNSEVNIPRSNTTFINAHFAVIFVSCSPIPPQWAMSSWSQLESFLCPTSAWMPSNLQLNTFLCTGHECRRIFFITDHFLSSFFQLSIFWRMMVYFVCDTLVRKSSGC